MRNHRTYALVYLTIPVAVQQKTSNIAGIETYSYRESNICSSLFLIACYYTTYWTGRTDMGEMSDTASRLVFVIRGLLRDCEGPTVHGSGKLVYPFEMHGGRCERFRWQGQGGNPDRDG